MKRAVTIQCANCKLELKATLWELSRLRIICPRCFGDKYRILI